MKRGLIPAAWLLTAIPAPAQSPLIARARSLELSTPYVPPPGDPLEHHAAGLAKVVCSAVFVTGLAPEFAVQNLGFFTAPYEERAKLGRPAIDRAPLESWSMGKTITATLMGILIRRGAYDLWQPAPVPEWRQPGDPRAKIRIADLLNMSSGLRIRAPQDPDYDPSGPYPDHVYLYTGGINSFHYAATRPLQWPPGTVGR